MFRRPTPADLTELSRLAPTEKCSEHASNNGARDPANDCVTSAVVMALRMRGTIQAARRSANHVITNESADRTAY